MAIPALLLRMLSSNLSKREISRLAQNERRKIQRRLARELSNLTGQKVTWKDSIDYANKIGYKSQLVSDYESLSGKKGYTQKTLETVAENTVKYTRRNYGSDTLNTSKKNNLAAKNKMFENEINLASKGVDFYQYYDSISVKSFYAGTRDLWKGVTSQENRNKVIADKLGIKSYQEIFDMLIKPKEEFASEEEYKKFIDSIPDNIRMRREIIQQEIKRAKVEGEYENMLKNESNKMLKKRGYSSTEDDAFNSDTGDRRKEDSPDFLTRIVLRISDALNRR